jgi:hypothetical protein
MVNILKRKSPQWIFLILILLISSLNLLSLSSSVSIQYLMLLLGLFSIIISFLINQAIFLFFLKLFLKPTSDDIQIIKNTFAIYLFLNTLFFLFLQKINLDISVLSLVNPVLILYLFIIFIFLKQSFSIKQIIWPISLFYLFNLSMMIVGLVLQK